MNQLHTSGAISQRPLWIIIGFLIVAPLSCFESLDALKYTSSLSISFILFLTIIIVMFAFPNLSGLDPCENVSDAMSCKGEEEYFLLNLGSLKALSIFVFSYTCQQVIWFIDKYQNKMIPYNSNAWRNMPCISSIQLLLISSFILFLDRIFSPS